MRVREPAVAGLFYPDGARALAEAIDAHLDAGTDAGPAAGGGPARAPKAIIGPHAGYAYSGPVAGTAYATVADLRGTVERVVLLGPAHRVALDGLAVPGVDAFVTPLGPVEIDRAARDVALAHPGVVADDLAHTAEHSLEVHLPFLQHVLGEGFRVLPIVAGRVAAEQVANVLDALWGGPETLVVVSSDLSHYEPYASAQAHDRRTATAIEHGALAGIGSRDACGAYPIRGLLAAAPRHGLAVELLDLRNSGDTAGPRDRVVGYGAFALRPRSDAPR